MTEKLTKGKVRQLKRKVKAVLQEQGDKVQYAADAKWTERWQRICDSPTIDYNNPYVKVEKTLNNVHVQRILANQRLPVEKRREQARPYFPDEETWQLYLTGIQPLDPDRTPYTYIESKSYVRHATYVIKDNVQKPFKK